MLGSIMHNFDFSTIFLDPNAKLLSEILSGRRRRTTKSLLNQKVNEK